MTTKIFIILVIVFAIASVVYSQDGTLSAIQRSHIDANVPDEKDFDTFLRRDITAYVTDRNDKEVKVKIELLRDKPTQSGVALPKFYVWIEKSNASGEVIEEAAARIAAVEKKKFEVIQYYDKARILKEPDLMKGVFPDEVYQRILTKIKAGTK